MTHAPELPPNAPSPDHSPSLDIAPSDAAPTVPAGDSFVVTARGLRKSFGDLEAVRGIEFQVRHGEVFGFLGPNGAGKTTTMKMIYGFVTVTAGELQVLGRDVQSNPRWIKQRLGVVHQDNNLDPDLSARDILLSHARFYRIPRREAETRADELLAFFQLRDKADSIPRKLSGGMLRRLMLARALMNNPEILILDEPTTGLDPQARHLLWHRLRELRRQGITILLTSHYMDEVEILCDRLVLIHEGSIIARGSPGELIQQYVGHEMFEVEIVDPDRREDIRKTLEAGAEGVRPRIVEEFGDRIYVACDDDCKPEEWLKGLDPAPRWWRRPASLEDVFLHLAGRDLRE